MLPCCGNTLEFTCKLQSKLLNEMGNNLRQCREIVEISHTIQVKKLKSRQLDLGKKGGSNQLSVFCRVQKKHHSHLAFKKIPLFLLSVYNLYNKVQINHHNLPNIFPKMTVEILDHINNHILATPAQYSHAKLCWINYEQNYCQTPNPVQTGI